MEQLILSHNPLSTDFLISFSSIIKESKSLKKLNISGLPESAKEGLFCFMKDLLDSPLQELDISKNIITPIISEVIEKNTTLKCLSISRTNIITEDLIDISYALEHNTTLNSLDLSNINIQEDSYSSLARALKTNKSLIHINLSGLPLKENYTELMDGLLGSHSLLDVKMNDVTEFSQSALDYAVQMIRNNRFNSLSLNDVPFSQDNLMSVADALSLNTSLKHLSLIQETSYPRAYEYLSIAYEKSLTLLTLETNHPTDGKFKFDKKTLENLGIRAFPSLFKAIHLTSLSLRNNAIPVIPAEITQLSNLSYLDISHNNVRSLPLDMGYMTNLKTLHLSHNPFRTPPPDILRSNNTNNILGFLKDLKTSYAPVYRIKLMAVGQENVGKTSLLKNLKNYRQKKFMFKKFQHKLISTDGIDIDEWQMEVNFPDTSLDVKNSGVSENKRRVKISTWDFAGQETYYTTHQFFLSKKSIYLLAWDLRYDAEQYKVGYWLQSIRARTKDSAVIIIGTHSDCLSDPGAATKKAEDVRRKYQRRFPFIKKSIAISSKNESDIALLYDSIKDIISVQSFMGELIPKSYNEMERLIREEAQRIKEGTAEYPPIRSLQQIREIGSYCNIETMEELKRCLHFLHDLGVLIYFDEPDLKLQSIVIIDPQFLTNVMATIITTKHKIRNGILHHQDLSMIWRAPEFPETIHYVLLNLLEKFEILYTLPESLRAKFGHNRALPQNIHGFNDDMKDLLPEDIETLVPSLLPEEKPRYDLLWVQVDPSVVQFDRIYVFDFVPKGFFSRLMIRCLHIVDTVNVYWRNGIIAHRKEDLFSLELDNSSSTLSLSVRGPILEPPTETLRLCVDIVDALIGMDKWFNIPVQRLVPCTHCRDLNINKPTMFQVSDLNEKLSRNQSTVDCYTTGTDEKVFISSLLPDVTLLDLEKFKISYNSLVIDEKLKETQHEIVSKGKLADQIVLIKSLKNSAKVKELEYRREAWYMSIMKHPNLVQMVGFSTSPFTIVTEYVHDKSLHNLIKCTKDKFSWAFILRIALDISTTMYYLHNSTPQFVHKSINSHNILILDENPNASICAKVSTFEFESRQFPTSKDIENTQIQYIAPECISNGDYSEKSDIYSFGVLLWALCTQQQPFSEYKTNFTFELKELILGGKLPTIPNDVPDDMFALIQACWAFNPQDRISSLEIIKWIIVMSADLAPKLEINEHVLVIKLAMSMNNGDTAKNSKQGDTRDVNYFGNQIMLTKPPIPVIIHSLCKVDNTIWGGCSEGIIVIWHAKNGEYLMHKKIANFSITSICYTKGHVFTLSLGEKCSVWTHYTSDEANLILGIKRKEGYLTQRTGNITKSSKRRFLLIKAGQLFILKDDKTKTISSFTLTNVSVTGEPSSKKSGFTITLKSGKQLSFSCRDKEQQDDWVSALMDEIEKKNAIYTISHVTDLLMSDVRSLCVIDGDLWAGTTSLSLKVWDGATLQIKNNTSFSIPSLPSDELNMYYISTILEYENRIWIGIHKYIVCIDKKTMYPIRMLESHSETVRRLAGFSNNLWSCSDDGTVKVWSTRTYKCRMTFSELGGKQFDMINLGDHIWSGGWDGKIRVFNGKSLQLERSIPTKHTQPISAFCLSLGTLWSGSWDGTVNVWN